MRKTDALTRKQAIKEKRHSFSENELDLHVLEQKGPLQEIKAVMTST